jgi:hypothetical protein
MFNRFECVNTLLENGADPLMLNGDPDPPMQTSSAAKDKDKDKEKDEKDKEKEKVKETRHIPLTAG